MSVPPSSPAPPPWLSPLSAATLTLASAASLKNLSLSTAPLSSSSPPWPPSLPGGSALAPLWSPRRLPLGLLYLCSGFIIGVGRFPVVFHGAPFVVSSPVFPLLPLWLRPLPPGLTLPPCGLIPPFGLCSFAFLFSSLSPGDAVRGSPPPPPAFSSPCACASSPR